MTSKLNRVYKQGILKKLILSTGFILLITVNGYAQKNSEPCKVRLESIANEYKGECKKGLAHGQGTAKGIHRYVGHFKDGLPDGQGTYYFSDSTYYTGNFQEGIKEGKEELVVII